MSESSDMYDGSIALPSMCKQTIATRWTSLTISKWSLFSLGLEKI